MTPVWKVAEPRSFSGSWPPGAPNSRWPEPSTSGKTNRWSSSTRPSRSSEAVRVPLPVMPMFWPGCCLSAAMSASALAAGIRVEFCQPADFSVPETTYLGVLFIVSAISPACSGQCAANSSYVTRPSRMASWAPISDPTACPSSGAKYGPIHCSGLSVMPSSEVMMPATIFLIGALPHCWLVLTLRTGTGQMDTTAEKFPEVGDALPDDGQRRRPPAGRAALRRHGEVRRGADPGRGAAGHRRPGPRYARHRVRREHHADRRSVHRVQRGDRELRAARGAVAGRGAGAGQAVLEAGRGRRGRHPPGVRPRGLMAAETEAAHRAIEAVWRLESARIIAGLAGLLRDVGLAEELAQDALVAALEQWPAEGIPANPGGWLMLTARHRAIDRIRRNERLRAKLNLLGRELETAQDGAPAEFDDVLDEGRIDDDLLRLMFISCHPVLSTEARIALTLRLLGGLTTEEIARAFLAAEPAIAKRIVRAKKTLGGRQVPFEVPSLAERPGRLASVLEVIYLVFNEGYAAMAGDDFMRPALCGEALRLGWVLAGLMPGEAEVHGLVALMEIQASRLAARLDADGLPVPLPEQNRGRWDQLLIRRGFTALLRAQELGGAPGPYVLQAAIAACHARARDAAETDWEQIALLYRALGALAPSPVVELNRAVAVAMAFGPERGLEVVDGLAGAPALAAYHHLPSVRGDLLARLGRDAEAAAEFRRAAALTRNVPERTVLLRRATACDART